MAHALYATRPIILFFQNYLPVVEINLKRAAVLLVAVLLLIEGAVPLSLLEKGEENVWQIRPANRILNSPKHSRHKRQS